jgi:hypothetical protein
VGIGKASPGYKLVVAAATGNVMQFENTSDSDRGGRITNTGTAGTGKFGITTTSSGYGLSFGIDAVEKMLLDTSNNLNIVSGNVVMATSGKGIDFSAVTGGTGTATGNVLNDYEEGTFTPTVAGSTTAGVGVYVAQVGRYTKVGNLVTLQVYLDWTAHTGTGNMFLGNFPFTTSSTGYSAAAIGYVNNIALTAGNILTAFASSSTTYLNVYQTPTGGGTVSDVPIDTAGVIIYTVTYRV